MRGPNRSANVEGTFHCRDSAAIRAGEVRRGEVEEHVEQVVPRPVLLLGRAGRRRHAPERGQGAGGILRPPVEPARGLEAVDARLPREPAREPLEERAAARGLRCRRRRRFRCRTRARSPRCARRRARRGPAPSSRCPRTTPPATRLNFAAEQVLLGACEAAEPGGVRGQERVRPGVHGRRRLAREEVDEQRPGAVEAEPPRADRAEQVDLRVAGKARQRLQHLAIAPLPVQRLDQRTARPRGEGRSLRRAGLRPSGDRLGPLVRPVGDEALGERRRGLGPPRLGAALRGQLEHRRSRPRGARCRRRRRRGRTAPRDRWRAPPRLFASRDRPRQGSRSRRPRAAA